VSATQDEICTDFEPCFFCGLSETLEELAIQNAELFLNAGGESYQYIPALNDSDAHLTITPPTGSSPFKCA
jgi:protoheme ferro-lyase